MPRPRFAKLPPPRQARILEAAAKEFAAHGYQAASINRVLVQAGVSKGAAYYYFDDKEDLFLTVLRHYVALLVPTDLPQPATLTAETFWPALTELYRQPLLRSVDDPVAIGVLRAGWELWHQRLEEGPLAAYVHQQLAFGAALLRRGQALGLIRTDVPDDLLMGWVLALDEANDRWVLDHWHELDREGVVAAADRYADALRRLVSPKPERGATPSQE